MFRQKLGAISAHWLACAWSVRPGLPCRSLTKPPRLAAPFEHRDVAASRVVALGWWFGVIALVNQLRFDEYNTILGLGTRLARSVRLSRDR